MVNCEITFSLNSRIFWSHHITITSHDYVWGRLSEIINDILVIRGEDWNVPFSWKLGLTPLPMNLSHKKKEEEENPWHQQHLFSRRRASLNLSNVYVSCYTHMQMELYCFGRSTSNSSSGSSYIGLVIVLCSTSTTTKLIVVTSESENWLHCRIWGVIFVHSLFGWCTDESSHLANELIYEMENCTLFRCTFV